MATDVALSPAEAEPIGVEPDGLYEVVDGRVVEKVMGAYETDIANLLNELIAEFARPKGLGRSYVEVLFLLDPGRGLKRRPDVAFLTRERWPPGRRAPRQEAWDVVPDLMVEIVSPSNTASEVMIKVDDYFKAGARLVWVVYPIEGMVQVFDSASASRILRRGDALDGGDVLPGLRIPLATLFEDEPGRVEPQA